MGLPSVNAEVVPAGEFSVANVTASESQPDSLPNLNDRLFVAGFASANLLLIRLILCGTDFPVVHPELQRLWGISALLLGALAFLFCFPPVAVQAWQDILRAGFSLALAKAIILVLAAIATVNAAFFEPSAYQSQLLFDELALLCLFLSIEEFIAAKIEAGLEVAKSFDAKRFIAPVSKLEPYPDHAPVETQTTGSELKVGGLFKASVGLLVPCDGLIIEGMAEVSERRLSGAAITKLKHKGDKIFAGSIVRRGELLCEVTNAASDALISNFVEVLDQRLATEADRSLLGETWQTRIGVAIMFVSFSSAAYAYGVGSGITRAATIAAEVMMLCLLTRLSLIDTALAQVMLVRAFFRGMLLRAARTLKSLESVKNFIVDVISPFPHEALFVRSFRIIDERLEREKLISVILNLLGASDEQRDEAMAKYLLKLVPQPELHRIADLRTYDGRGLSGVVGGVDFTIGSEAFLIERGVQLQMNELVLLQDNEQALYVAMRDEVVAAFTLRSSAVEDPQGLGQMLKGRGVRFMACSTEPLDKVDRAGKLLGLELSDVFGELAPERYIEKMRGAGLSALLIDQQTNPSLAAESAVRFSLFDQLRWDLSQGDVLLLQDDLSSVGEAFRLRDTYRHARLGIQAMVCLAVLLAILSAALGLASAGLALGLLLLAFAGASFIITALSPNSGYSCP
ncbi:MAG: hypothetical protein K1X79_01345 [Oligoflexia bacterium]|nr:hypothetical protein [Oligoflexia bacterium]